MLTREKVLAELAVHGRMQTGSSMIYNQRISSGGFMCAEDIYIWRVRTCDALYEFMDEDVISAVDTFIQCQPPAVEFPDANELRELNKQEKEAAYNQWCEEHIRELQTIARSIYQANTFGKRTIEFDIPRNDTEGHYKRYFKERHYDVTIQQYSDENTDKRGLALCRLEWSMVPRRR